VAPWREHGIDPALSAVGTLIAHVKQLVWFGPIGLIAGSAGLGVDQATCSLLFAFCRSQRRR